LTAAAEEVSLSELVASLALATDLGMGQPLEHALRTCVLATTVGESLGLTLEELAETYYICLLRFVGCNAHAHQDALEVGDEIAFRAGVAPVLNGQTPEMLRFMVTKMGQSSPIMTRAKMVGSALMAGPKGAREPIAATCEVARMIALRLGMTPGVAAGLDYTFEHHDGTGFPNGVAGDEIPVSAHVAMVARDFEVLNRLGGREMVLEVARKRRGKAYRPQVLDEFLSHAWEVLDADSETGWDAVASAEPFRQVLTGDRFKQALLCVADFSDIKSPHTHGYSRAVSELVTRAAGIAGLDEVQTRVLGAAALVQELGMTAVPSAVLDKPGRLTDGEWERVRLHPYFTERILKRCAGLAPSGALAGAHHERVDGTGYHRGAAAAQIPASARLLSAAGCYVAMTSERSWRHAMPPARVAKEIRELAASGGLDPVAVDAILLAAGEPVTARRKAWPAGLTDREVQVLKLISRGRSNRQMAEDLVISPKTVGRHIENIYAKTGVSTRAGATMFALQNGLVGAPEGPS
jgi:HD-GYP domain-containing protein (c-di-GMP phosphodiesterase class II)/DNA-binding CsgD family transcriptional regulator